MPPDDASLPQAILHVDGDAFFASCEVAKNPRLRGKVVVTGEERGIVVACTYEGKAYGITRGMRMHEVRALCPSAVILPSDYETYSLFSKRMHAIVERFTSRIERYSIDECFADVTCERDVLGASYEDIARRVKGTLEDELCLSFSVGLAPTKTLAKVASKWHKPSGLTVIEAHTAAQFLSKTPIGEVWGIGPSTATFLSARGVHTAADFVRCEEAWVRERLAKPFVETWQELSGMSVRALNADGTAASRSLTSSRTFRPATSDVRVLVQQLSRNIEDACRHARAQHLTTKKVSFFLKTSDFAYHTGEVRLASATALPSIILAQIERQLPSAHKRGTHYRTTGVTLLDLVSDEVVQSDLFGASLKASAVASVYRRVDESVAKHGPLAVFLASSLRVAPRKARREERRADAGDTLFRGETRHRRLGIPHLGEVS